jgi:hypothetical protein
LLAPQYMFVLICPSVAEPPTSPTCWFLLGDDSVG